MPPREWRRLRKSSQRSRRRPARGPGRLSRLPGRTSLSGAEAKVGTLAAGVTASEKRLKDFSAYIARLEAREEQAEKERAAYLSKSLEAFEADLNGRLLRARERGETLDEEVFGRLSARIKEDETAFARSVQAIEMRLADYQGDVDYRVKALEESSNLDALRASLDESIVKMAAGVRTEMKEMAAGLVAGWQGEIAAATTAREKLHAGLDEVHAGLEELKTKAYQDVEKGLSVFEDEFFADLRQRAAQALDRVEGFEGDLKGRIAASDESVQGLRQRISVFEKELNGMVARAVQTIETRLADYQGDVESRIKSLEETKGDIEAARASISREIEKTMAQARATSDESAQGLRERMSAFETDLSGMASRAVQAVETRLADYQGDVESRIKSLEGAKGDIEAARVSISQEIEKSTAQARAQITEMATGLENEFGADLRQRAAQSLDRHQAWQADLEKRMGDFEAELKSRLSSSDESVQGLRDALRVEVEKTRKDASLSIEKETQSLRESLDASVRKSQREIETKLRELSAELEGGRKELGDVLDASRAEVVAWEGRARQQLSETEVSVAEKISRLASEAESSIGVVREEFASQREETLATFTQERAAFKTELKEIGDRISSFEAESEAIFGVGAGDHPAQMEKARQGHLGGPGEGARRG